MDWLSKRDFDIDVGAQLPHAALRVYVMGERGARRDPSTAEDNKAMAKLAGEAVRSGALGFSTSRTLNHRTSTGDFTPTLKAGEDELTAIAARCTATGRSVLQFVLDLSTLHEDLPMMLRVADNTKMPDLVLDHAERQGAAPLAPDAGRDQCGGDARPLHHRADRGAPGRPAARARAVAQPVPDPSELQGDRASAAGRAAGAAASARSAQGDPERDGDRDRRSAVLPAELRQDVSARRSPGLRAAAGERARARRRASRAGSRKSSPMMRCCPTKAAACSMCRSSIMPTAISMRRARC